MLLESIVNSLFTDNDDKRDTERDYPEEGSVDVATVDIEWDLIEPAS